MTSESERPPGKGGGIGDIPTSIDGRDPVDGEWAIESLHMEKAHFVLCGPDGRPMAKGWPDRPEPPDAVLSHIGDRGPVGIIPASIRGYVVVVDHGDPEEIIRILGDPLASVSTGRPGGRHLWYGAPDGLALTAKPYELKRGGRTVARGEVRHSRHMCVLWDSAEVADRCVWQFREASRTTDPRPLLDLCGPPPAAPEPDGPARTDGARPQRRVTREERAGRIPGPTRGSGQREGPCPVRGDGEDRLRTRAAPAPESPDADATTQTVTIEDLVPDPEEVRMPTMIVPGAVERGAVSVIYGEPGSGKSTIALLEAMAIATGRGEEMIGVPVVRSRVALLWTDESSHARDCKVAAVMARYGITADELRGWFKEVRVKLPLDRPSARAVEEVADEMAKAGAEVLYLDSLSSNAPAAESANEEAARLFNRLRGLAEARGAVVVLHHVRKPPAGQKSDIGLGSQRGASAIGAGVRCARQCEERKGADGEPSIYLVHTTKCSNAAGSGVRAFAITGFRVNDAPTLAPLAELTEAPACHDPFEGITDGDAVEAWGRICGLPVEKRRANIQASEWIGRSLAEALGLPCGTKDEMNRISGILRKWEDSGHLKRTTWKETGGGRHGRPVYERGRDLAAHGG